jgi:hypothetical protein
MGVRNQVLLKCRRTQSPIWKKVDIERYFELSPTLTALLDTNPIDNANLKKEYGKYDSFIVEPMSRISKEGDNPLQGKDDLFYFSIYGVDVSDQLLTRFIYCGYATAKKSTVKIFQ